MQQFRGEFRCLGLSCRREFDRQIRREELFRLHDVLESQRVDGVMESGVLRRVNKHMSQRYSSVPCHKLISFTFRRLCFTSDDLH